MLEHEDKREKWFMKIVDIVIGIAIMIVIFLSILRGTNLRF